MQLFKNSVLQDRRRGGDAMPQLGEVFYWPKTAPEQGTYETEIYQKLLLRAGLLKFSLLWPASGRAAFFAFQCTQLRGNGRHQVGNGRTAEPTEALSIS